MRLRGGFTLIEVMVSMFIMAMLTVLVSTTIRTAVQNKKKLEARVASETLLYDTLRVIRLDVERAFNYQDIFYQMEVTAIQQSQQNPGQGQGGGQGQGEAGGPGQNPGLGQGQGPMGGAGQQGMAPGAMPLPPPPPRLTHFLGEVDSMHFTALNHYRTQYNAQESDQMEVGYFVDSCQSRRGKGSSRCLWRRTSTLIDDRVDHGGSRSVLTEAVGKFKLSYRSDRENDPWVDQWRSDNRGRPDHRDRFPHLVRVELEIGEKDNPNLRPVSMTMVVRVLFPNNDNNLSNMNPQNQGGGARGGRP
jgi:prepilin-type N-terminal cleavage/methylation domain-containing protein